MKVTRFEDLEIWKLARGLYRLVYKITSEEPFCRDFKFRDQIRHSSGSVSDNIAEGFERGGNKEFIQFLSVARALMAKHVTSLTGHLTATILIRKRLMNFLNLLI